MNNPTTVTFSQKRKVRTPEQMKAIHAIAEQWSAYFDETVFKMFATKHEDQSASHEADSAKPREEDQ